MRKTLLGFLTLLMLTPIMMCGMAFCPMQAEASEISPCHQSDDNNGDGVMLVVDCMEVDLFQHDADSDIQHNISLDNVDYYWVDLDFISDFQLAANSIRGPPDNYINPRSYISLIHTTQRFRI